MKNKPFLFLQGGKAILLLFIGSIVFLTSCTYNLDHPAPQMKFRLFSGMKQGQYVEWDEDVVESNQTPSWLADSSSSYTDAFAHRQEGIYHVKVSLPDSTIPQIKTERTTTTIRAMDTNDAPSNVVWKTVAYNNEMDYYDNSSNLINSYTFTDTNTYDFSALPFDNYSDTAAHTDSERTVFITNATSAGASVTDPGGSADIKVSIGYSGVAFDSYFNRNFFTVDSIIATKSGNPYQKIFYTYSTVGAYRIATTTMSLEYNTFPRSMADYQAEFPDAYMGDGSFWSKRITTLSNISIP